MNKFSAIGIGIIALLVIGGLAYVVVPALSPANSMTVSFYDADNNLIDTVSTDPTVWDFSFMADGSEVTKIVVVVDYDTLITGEGSVTNIDVDCSLTTTVYLNTMTAGIVNGPNTRTESKTTASGTFEFTFYLDSLISPVESMGKQYGWSIQFEAELTGSASVDGSPVFATPWTDSVYANIDWDEEAVSMSFIGAYVGKVYP